MEFWLSKQADAVFMSTIFKSIYNNSFVDKWWSLDLLCLVWFVLSNMKNNKICKLLKELFPTSLWDLWGFSTINLLQSKTAVSHLPIYQALAVWTSII